MSDTAGFRTVMRGYEPAEVDRTIGQLRQALDEVRAEAAQRSVELTKLGSHAGRLESELAAQTAALAALRTEHDNTPPPSFLELGSRIGSMLSLAEEEATEIRAAAQRHADTLTADSQAAADQARTNADRYAAEVASRADAEATRIVENAKRQADDILDHADREATARREEAEAVYEHQRARAAGAAADFEKTLAARRNKAAADFAAQMAANEAALARAEERHAGIEADAERLRTAAEAQAEATRKAADDEAASLMQHARQAAEKIRKESERELLAATSRRDAITAQLTNVRQMLATLGGAAIVNPLGDEEPIPGVAADASGAGTADPDAGDLPTSGDQAG